MIGHQYFRSSGVIVIYKTRVKEDINLHSAFVMIAPVTWPSSLQIKEIDREFKALYSEHFCFTCICTTGLFFIQRFLYIQVNKPQIYK